MSPGRLSPKRPEFRAAGHVLLGAFAWLVVVWAGWERSSGASGGALDPSSVVHPAQHATRAALPQVLALLEGVRPSGSVCPRRNATMPDEDASEVLVLGVGVAEDGGSDMLASTCSRTRGEGRGETSE